MKDIEKFKRLLNSNIFVTRPSNIVNGNVNNDIIIINIYNRERRTYVRKEQKWKEMNALFKKPQNVEEICNEINNMNIK